MPDNLGALQGQVWCRISIVDTHVIIIWKALSHVTMSHFEFKKRPSRPVELKGQWPGGGGGDSNMEMPRYVCQKSENIPIY